ncbi:hypothetical protein LINPERHAP2_LOCUS81, partial [Linum perenne]
RVSATRKNFAALTRRGTVITCSACRQQGHNKRGCKAGACTTQGPTSPNMTTTSTPAGTRTPAMGGSPRVTRNRGTQGDGRSGAGLEFMPTPRVP